MIAGSALPRCWADQEQQKAPNTNAEESMEPSEGIRSVYMAVHCSGSRVGFAWYDSELSEVNKYHQGIPKLFLAFIELMVSYSKCETYKTDVAL